MTARAGPLERALHPGAWWLWALGMAVAASRTTNPVLLGLLLAAVGCVVVRRRTDAPWALSFRMYLVFGAVIVVMRVLFRVVFGGGGGDTVLVTLPEIPLPEAAAGIRLLGPVAAEEVLGGFYDGLQLATMVICVGAANALANPKRMLKAMPGALHEVGTAVVVALTVAPQLIESVQRVRRARRLRGARERGRHALRGILIPVLEDALGRSLSLAAAMASRGYGRTGTTPPGARRAVGALLIGGLLGIAAGLYGLMGSGSPRYLGLPLVVGGAADHQREAEVAGGARAHQPVESGGDAQQAADQQGADGPPGAGRGGPGAAVAAGGHGRGQGQGPAEGVLQDGDEDAAQRVPAPLPGTAQPARPAHALHALDQLGRHGERDDDGRAHLVERAGHGLEHALGVGQGVGGADADHHGGQLEPVVEPAEHLLGGHRAEQPDPGRGLGQRDLREGDQDGVAPAAAEHDAEQDPHHDDHGAEDEVHPERERPGRVRPAPHHDAADGGQQQPEQHRVGGAGRRDRHAERPQPPGARVQGALQRARAGGHPASADPADRRLRRAAYAAAPARAASRPSAATVNAEGPPEPPEPSRRSSNAASSPLQPGSSAGVGPGAPPGVAGGDSPPGGALSPPGPGGPAPSSGGRAGEEGRSPGSAGSAPPSAPGPPPGPEPLPPAPDEPGAPPSPPEPSASPPPDSPEPPEPPEPPVPPEPPAPPDEPSAGGRSGATPGGGVPPLSSPRENDQPSKLPSGGTR